MNLFELIEEGDIARGPKSFRDLKHYKALDSRTVQDPKEFQYMMFGEVTKPGDQ